MRFGNVEEEIRVTVDPEELVALGLTAPDLADRLAGADPKVPAESLRTDDRQGHLEVTGALDTTARIAAVPLVADEQRMVNLGGLARVTKAWRTKRGEGLAAAESAVRHLFPPLAASTFTTILSFMPIFLLPGNVGDFIDPIAVSVILALAASFAVSMTIIPALAALLAQPARSVGR